MPETENFVLEDLFSSLLSQIKKYHPSGNPIFNNFGIFQSLKFRILWEKSFHFHLTKFHSKYFGLLWVTVIPILFQVCQELKSP